MQAAGSSRRAPEVIAMGAMSNVGVKVRLQSAWASTTQMGTLIGAPLSGAAARPAAAVARNNFDALRLAAALLVVYGHQMPDATGTVGLRLVMFFAISGFLVAGSWNADPHAGRFLVRRFLRIWPAYAVVILVCAAMTYAFPAGQIPWLSRLGSELYLSNLWFAGFDWAFFSGSRPFINQSLWMIPYEVDIYLAVAAIGLLGRRWLWIAACLVLLFALRAPVTDRAVGGVLDCWSLYFGGFFAFGLLLREFPVLRRSGVVAGCVAVGVVLLMVGERTAGLLAVIPPAAVWVGERSWPVLRSASRFGDLSLGIFLWGSPVQQVTHLWLDPRTPLPLQLAVVLVQVVPLAWLSWRFVEAPALRRKPAKPHAPKRADFDDLVSA
jgi:peptidoglycan/LPS O-acetylase OafA/YrhL